MQYAILVGSGSIWTRFWSAVAFPLGVPARKKVLFSSIRVVFARSVALRECLESILIATEGILEHMWMHFVSVLEQDFDASLKEL